MKIWVKWAKDGVWWTVDQYGYRLHHWFGIQTFSDDVGGSRAWCIQINLWKLLIMVGFRG